MDKQDRPGSKVPDQLRQRLDETERGLLRIHKALLEHERLRYESTRGPVGGPAQFLQLLIHDPWFAWLRPISQLAAQIDEFTRSRAPREPNEGEALFIRARSLLSPSEAGDDFQRQYHRCIRESADVAAAHGHWSQWATTQDPR